MEPGHEDREEASASATRSAEASGRNGARSRGPGRGLGLRYTLGGGQRPQWSPVTRTGKSASALPPGDVLRPQWSPVTRTGKSRRPGAQRRQQRRGRNGARSRGPGRAALMARRLVTTSRPQWSPVTRTGKSRHVSQDDRSRVTAAMEPGHEDREEGCLSRPTGPRSSCRNGARSRGPGREVDPQRLLLRLGEAAMEPGHEDREELRMPLL